jgi:hypothetical protein
LKGVLEGVFGEFLWKFSEKKIFGGFCEKRFLRNFMKENFCGEF